MQEIVRLMNWDDKSKHNTMRKVIFRTFGHAVTHLKEHFGYWRPLNSLTRYLKVRGGTDSSSSSVPHKFSKFHLEDTFGSLCLLGSTLGDDRSKVMDTTTMLLSLTDLISRCTYCPV